MAKKFGKFVLFTAAAAAACAGVYYYFQKKEQLADADDFDDEDYDDFNEDLDEESNRSYVSLNLDETAEKESADDAETNAPFEKLSELVSDVSEQAEEKVEEFFDEGDE